MIRFIRRFVEKPKGRFEREPLDEGYSPENIGMEPEAAGCGAFLIRSPHDVYGISDRRPVPPRCRR